MDGSRISTLALLVAIWCVSIVNCLAQNSDQHAIAGLKFVFASEEVGREKLVQRDSYIDQMSGFDRKVRMRKQDDPGVDAFLKFASAQVRSWPTEERKQVLASLRKLEQNMAKLGLRHEDPIFLVYTTGIEESGAAYTRGKTITLPRTQIGPGAQHARIMAHELFHVISRADPVLRDSLYATIGFHRTGPIELPAALADRRLTNPDAPIVEHAMELKIAPGQRVQVAPVLYSKREFDPDLPDKLFQYLTFRLLEVESVEGRFRGSVDAHGEPKLRPPNTPDFFRQIGRNTKYIIHPEEILADNFSFLLLGKDVRDTWIIERMRECFLDRFPKQP